MPLAGLFGYLTDRRRAFSLTGLIAGTFVLGLVLGSAISLWSETAEPEKMALLPLEPAQPRKPEPSLQTPAPVVSAPLAAPRVPVSVEALPPLALAPRSEPENSGPLAGEEALAQLHRSRAPEQDLAASPQVVPAATLKITGREEQASLLSSAPREAAAGTGTLAKRETAPPLIINGPETPGEVEAATPAQSQLAVRTMQQPEEQPLKPPHVKDQQTGQAPAWQRNAVQLASLPSGPAIAIVIDDVGLNRPGANRSVALPAPVTLALMTYAEGLESLASRARAAGHELMVHMPMQPIDAGYNAGVKVLTVGLPREELLQRISWGLERFDGYVGINNHMGSRFTTDSAGMATVMAELKRRGLMFLDSKTVGHSLGVTAARGAGVPVVARDIFLDHEQSPDFIKMQLRALEALARQRGYAIGIGHPHGITLQALESWIPQARARGISFVPVSAILGLQERHLASHVAGNSG